MALIEDIRAWGRENGWDVPDEGRLPTGLRKAYDDRQSVAEQSTTDLSNFDSSNTFGSTDYADVLEWPSETVEEIAPVIREESPKAKAKSFINRIRKAAPAAPAKPRGRKPAKARVSLEKLVTLGWRFLAQMAEPINPPVARMLDIQAPVAGMLLEDQIRNTLVDRLLQPLARVEKGGELAFALLGPPLLVGAITQRPDMQKVLVPFLRESMRTWIDVAGDKLEEHAKKEQEFQDTYGARIDEMLAVIFAPPEGM